MYFSIFRVQFISMKTARVTEEHKTNYVILDTDNGNELVSTVRGSFFDKQTFPKVGDFVLYAEIGDGKAIIEDIVPRTSSIVRKSVHTGLPQTIVANVDVIFIVMGLDKDFNLSRLERYLLLAEQSEVKSVVVLSKSDVVEDSLEYVRRTTEVVGGVPVYAVSALTGSGMDELLTQISTDTTVVLLGSSGAGKSTITNWLLQEDKQKISNVRTDDNRGRHTTTSRQLFSLPTGGYLIDTPGMRELSVLDSTSGDEETVFLRIEELSRQCKFSNCDHDKSDGCAVLEAIKVGEISDRQLQNYHKLQRERLLKESRSDAGLSLQEKQRKVKLDKKYKKINKQTR